MPPSMPCPSSGLNAGSEGRDSFDDDFKKRRTLSLETDMVAEQELDMIIFREQARRSQGGNGRKSFYHNPILALPCQRAAGARSGHFIGAHAFLEWLRVEDLSLPLLD